MIKLSNIKIGIITFHDAISYGATLQCYGLQKFLLNNKYEVKIIDYSMSGYLELRRRNKIKALNTQLNKVLINPKKYFKIIINRANKQIKQKDGSKQIRDNKFASFRKKHYELSETKYKNFTDLNNNCPNYNAFICGSDQIWNPFFCDRDSNYYLDFAPIEKRIAYAPSFGVTNLPSKFENEYINKINGIPYLSIREKSGQEIIRKLTGRKVPIVIDPSFLLSPKEWMELAKESEINIEKKYILTYFIGDDIYIQNYIKEVKEDFCDYEIINLVFDYSEFGPCDFIKLISNAEFVFTNSFHGMSFCINFNIPFGIGKSLKDFSEDSGFTRMQYLLERLGLENRIISKDNPLNRNWISMDFYSSNQKLNVWRNYSKNFLLTAISEVVFGGNNRSQFI